MKVSLLTVALIAVLVVTVCSAWSIKGIERDLEAALDDLEAGHGKRSGPSDDKPTPTEAGGNEESTTRSGTEDGDGDSGSDESTTPPPPPTSPPLPTTGLRRVFGAVKRSGTTPSSQGSGSNDGGSGRRDDVGEFFDGLYHDIQQYMSLYHEDEIRHIHEMILSGFRGFIMLQGKCETYNIEKDSPVEHLESLCVVVSHMLHKIESGCERQQYDALEFIMSGQSHVQCANLYIQRLDMEYNHGLQDTSSRVLEMWDMIWENTCSHIFGNITEEFEWLRGYYQDDIDKLNSEDFQCKGSGAQATGGSGSTTPGFTTDGSSGQTTDNGSGDTTTDDGTSGTTPPGSKRNTKRELLIQLLRRLISAELTEKKK